MTMSRLQGWERTLGGRAGGEGVSADGEGGGRRGSQDLAPEVAAAREECSARVSARERRACCRGWGSREREGLGGDLLPSDGMDRWTDGWTDVCQVIDPSH